MRARAELESGSGPQLQLHPGLGQRWRLVRAWPRHKLSLGPNLGFCLRLRLSLRRVDRGAGLG